MGDGGAGGSEGEGWRGVGGNQVVGEGDGGKQGGGDGGGEGGGAGVATASVAAARMAARRLSHRHPRATTVTHAAATVVTTAHHRLCIPQDAFPLRDRATV